MGQQKGFSAIIIAIAIAAIVIVGISVLLLLSGKKQPVAVQPSAIPSMTLAPSAIPKITPVPKESTAASKLSLKQIKNANFTVAVPVSWQNVTRAVIKGGTLTSFSPTTSETTEPFPRIDIQSTPLEGYATTDQIITNLAPLQLQQSNITFHGIQATQLSGALPFQFTSMLTPKTVSKTFIIFKTDTSQYVIDYAYYNDQDAQANQRAITSILTTLTLQ